jgi:hypothetical protein
MQPGKERNAALRRACAEYIDVDNSYKWFENNVHSLKNFDLGIGLCFEWLRSGYIMRYIYWYKKDIERKCGCKPDRAGYRLVENEGSLRRCHCMEGKPADLERPVI